MYRYSYTSFYLRKPQVLILDEATHAIDVTREGNIYRYWEHLQVLGTFTGTGNSYYEHVQLMGTLTGTGNIYMY
jgi:energy-coupling factor transporter ATP-binding protein EcfA2